MGIKEIERIAWEVVQQLRSLAGEELHVEDKGGVGGDHGGVAARAVGVVGRASELGTLADRHLGDALIPALDDLAHADLEKNLSPRSRELSNLFPLVRVP